MMMSGQISDGYCNCKLRPGWPGWEIAYWKASAIFSWIEVPCANPRSNRKAISQRAGLTLQLLAREPEANLHVWGPHAICQPQTSQANTLSKVI